MTDRRPIAPPPPPTQPRCGRAARAQSCNGAQSVDIAVVSTLGAAEGFSFSSESLAEIVFVLRFFVFSRADVTSRLPWLTDPSFRGLGGGKESASYGAKPRSALVRRRAVPTSVRSATTLAK